MSTKTTKKVSQRPYQGYNTLPINVTQKEFNRHIKPHLSMATRGVRSKLSYYKIFNCILYVLHTGIPWYTLPVRGVHWTNVYKHHNRWSKDGSYQKTFERSLEYLAKERKLDFNALHGDGSNVVAKKGELVSATRGTNTSVVKKPLISKTIRAMSSLPVLRHR